MHLTRPCAALGLILCAVAACGGPAPPNRNDTNATTLPAPSGPARAFPDERAIDMRPHAWTQYDLMDDNRIRIHYTITGLPQCNQLGKVDVEESAGAVTVTLHIGRMPGAPCAAKVLKATEVFTEVELAAPLGTRTTNDGSK